ncbi:HNH endonuclease signature motif containing protein [Streptomyces sp. NPDC056883]|uniref:HNH endonuclease signature motif containing protein n=1 Tax=Streptomyces sp. NPDC056883 TaxID=3345959 RepID=UPI003674B1BC
MSHFKPSPKLCKLLFGRASHCAYPECEELLIQEHRGKLSVTAQIAHIRAESIGGPRYDADFEGVNSEENLLLLCPKHHGWIDDFEDDYPVDELLDWKRRQAAQGRSAGLTENQAEQIFLLLTTPRAEAEAVGVISAGGENIVSKIENVPSFKLLNADSEQRFMGVRISNVGAIGFDVDSVGVEIDVDGPAPFVYGFPAMHRLHRPPRRLEPQANGVWLADPDTVCNGIRLVMQRVKVYAPVRFRAFGNLGSGGRVFGPWVSALHLPIWEDHVTQEWLDGFVDLAKQTREKLGRDT